MAKRTVKSSKKLKDSDGDGLSDQDEINIFGSDPYNADSDGDGIEDGEAVLNGRDPVGGGRLKDFFIPHAGNNYQPKVLNPKRVLFHGAAALAVKAIVIFFVAYYPVVAWMTPDIAAGEAQKIIALTNELRKNLSLPALTENSKLDAAAAKKVEDMFLNQYFAHVSPSGLDLEHFLALVSYNNYATAGENLAMGYKNSEEAMAAWEKSPTHYANLTDNNYSQIGVGLAPGSYAGTETILIAQYFGLPQMAEAGEAANNVIKRPATVAQAASASQAVLAEKTAVKKIVKTTSAPLLTRDEAKITVATPVGKPTEKVIRVEAVLPAGTKSAVAQVEDKNIVLAPVAATGTALLAPAAVPQSTTWVGQGAMAVEAGPASVVPPVIVATDNQGNVAQVMVSPDSVKPQRTSILNQYLAFRTQPNKDLGVIFDASSIYFKILLLFAFVVLALNIFIQIKKQHPKLIMSGLGLIALLVMLIIF